MGELTIQGFSPVRYQGAARTQRAAPAERSQGAARAGFTVSETLQELMSRVSRAEGQTRESRKTLQLGEGVLAEVQDRLARMAELARRASGGGTDRAALQEELEGLWKEIDRMIGSASVNGTRLFLDGDLGGEDGLEALLYAVMDKLQGGQEGVQGLPNWFLQGLTADLTPEELLEGLGLDQSATGAELLAALANADLEHNPAAGRLAALYLGAVIAGGGSPKGVSGEEAVEGLRMLLERIAQGETPDEAVEQLTEGTFTSFADLQRQLMQGTAPGLQGFLKELLLTGEAPGALLPQPPLLGLLAGLEGMDLELMMGLLTAARSGEGGAEQQAPVQAGDSQSAPSPQAAQEAGRSAQAAGEAPLQVRQLGELQVMGRDLSGVHLDDVTGVLTLGGHGEVAVQGNGTKLPGLVLAGPGTVLLRDVNAAVVTASAPQVQLRTAGESAFGTLQLDQGVRLVLGGTGFLKLGTLRGDASNLLRLTGGAAAVEQEERLAVPVVLEGLASLAARAASVTTPQGRVPAPFELVWKTFLPGWSGLTALSVDGQPGKLALSAHHHACLWLDKGDPSHGYSTHTLALRGRDEAGKLRTRYAYLRWSRKLDAFEEVSMYPNPFQVTGGEEGMDWEYEEEPHILHILSPAVTALAGGMGEDGARRPFSGRIALADGIGALELALNGVSCRVSAGRAFCLGRGNDVTLMLRRGSSNHFESGEGCAGISLGDGTSLSIDCARPGGDRTPAGSLTAIGRAGGAGIGRDSGAGRERSGSIVIRGGVVTGTGSGGGAGIGAGKSGPIGPVTVTGGVVSANGGSGGGAGIGGALGAPAGDIRIQGGSISATAAFHAAAIGAGIHGDCGDIRIGGSARIVRASGGDPGADIGACLFGGCGEVHISGAADIGSARLSPKTGVRLPMGGEPVTLPQFRLSARAMQLDQLSVATRERAREATRTVDADRRWVARIQAAYSALYERLERSRTGLYSVQRYLGQGGGPLRDSGDALSLLRGVSQSIPQNSAQAMRTHSRRSREDVRQLFQ